MVELVENIAKALVSKPDEVIVTQEGTPDDIVIKLKVSEDDMGKVIGKQGRVAKAIRTVVKSVAVRNKVKVNVEIVED